MSFDLALQPVACTPPVQPPPLRGVGVSTLLATGTRRVSVRFRDRMIGTGTANVSPSFVEVSGIYDLPPRIDREGFFFSVELRPDHGCSISADWPALLRGMPIDAVGHYTVVVALGRPGLVIAVGDYRINVRFSGPVGRPDIVSGFNVDVVAPDTAAALTFSYL
jgi:hypothetical protein